MRPVALAARLRDFVLSPLVVHLDRVYVSLRARHLLALAGAERYADPRCLTRYGYRIFSQNDEDGIIDEIVQRIGTTNRFFVECGVGDGFENNTLALLVAGWRGLWIEAESSLLGEFQRAFRPALEERSLTIDGSLITAENIEHHLTRGGVPEEPDLLSIDIDGNDYWIWKAIIRFRPRVVVIEYNASLGRSARLAVPYEASLRWDRTIYFGASLAAMEALGREKGYALVGCSLSGVNAFFVREDCVGGCFLAPFSSTQHYEPPRFGATGGGHAPRGGRFEAV
jgi:hypothetical protein